MRQVLPILSRPVPEVRLFVLVTAPGPIPFVAEAALLLQIGIAAGRAGGAALLLADVPPLIGTIPLALLLTDLSFPLVRAITILSAWFVHDGLL